MMTLTDNTIDEMIRRVKAQPNVLGFVFSSAYPPRDTPYPIGKYHVAVENLGMKESKFFIGGAVGEGRRGALYATQVRVRVYAPIKSSGSALLRASAQLARAFEKSDPDGLIRSISMGGVDDDNVTRSLYRDMEITLEQVVCEEEPDE